MLPSLFAIFIEVWKEQKSKAYEQTLKRAFKQSLQALQGSVNGGLICFYVI